MEELRECPFCGSNCINDTTEPTPDKLGMYYWVCPCCVSCGPSAVSVKEASRLWNTRPTPEAIEGIEWTRHCGECGGEGEMNDIMCEVCNGTGTITRQATMAECLEASKVAIRLSFCINGGTLRLKEGA
jgi:hypothetical protein